MALVAYDNSDSSEYEDEDNEKTVNLLTQPTKPAVSTEAVIQTSDDDSTAEKGPTPQLFTLLPQPSTKKQAVVEEDDEFLHKKETVNVVKPKAKITVPSLSDFKDVDAPVITVKPKAAATKKSGLLSILPQPKNGLFTGSAKSLIPNILTQKPNNVKNKAPLPSPMKKLKDSKSVTEYSDESDNEDVQNDFFSFNKLEELPEPVDIPIDLPEIKTIEEPKVSKLESYFKKDVVEDHMLLQPDDTSCTEYADSEAGSSYNGHEVETTNNGDAVLDEEAILKLCGSRGKRKREEIQIVDVKQDEVLAEAQQWLLKGLMDDTSKRVSASKKRGNEPTHLQKRKHQITYLAHQAKANEVDLQNQWANNRMSKRQTQSKYGF